MADRQFVLRMIGGFSPQAAGFGDATRAAMAGQADD